MTTLTRASASWASLERAATGRAALLTMWSIRGVTRTAIAVRSQFRHSM
jgi:hypothetical protein